jgi:hypothetical protein
MQLFQKRGNNCILIWSVADGNRHFTVVDRAYMRCDLQFLIYKLKATSNHQTELLDHTICICHSSANHTVWRSKRLVNFITCGCESSVSFFCNLQSRARIHAVLVIYLYEMLGIPTSHPPTRTVYVLLLLHTVWLAEEWQIQIVWSSNSVWWFEVAFSL